MIINTLLNKIRIKDVPKGNLIYLLPAILIILALCAYIYMMNVNAKEYLNTLNINVRGVVIETKRVTEQNDALITMNLLNSNKTYHDVRDERKVFFCVIKNGKMEFFVSSLMNYDVGDTISINTKERIIVNETKKEVRNIWLPVLTYDFYPEARGSFSL
jgi:hypothetical protein